MSTETSATPTALLPAVSFGRVASLMELLADRVRLAATSPAYTFCATDADPVTITFAELERRAQVIAAQIQQHTQPGDRVLLVYPPGLDFVTAFFGCVYAGVLAVPATYPKPRRPMPRLSAIARDCNPKLAMTTSSTVTLLDLARSAPELESITWISTDVLPDDLASQWHRPELKPQDLAFLQYTSGSTSEPKGVEVSHGNLLHNLETIRTGFDIPLDPDARDVATGVFWLPAYHDMGLIGGILEPLYVGGRSVLMAPTSFLQRPLRWLQLISEYGGSISGAPNFAYDLCTRKITDEQLAELDLSSWKLAFCGAEPVRAETLRDFAERFAPCGFSPEAFYPCYGLAESTLLAAGGAGPSSLTVKTVDRVALTHNRVVEVDDSTEENGQVQRLVSCGSALLDAELMIVSPATEKPCKPGQVGEIWVRGPSVAHGYWNRPAVSRKTFAAQLSGSNGNANTYLRTGDLGFISQGQLYVTGRVKDVIIIRGRNHYPEDIEQTIEHAHEALGPGAGAVVSLDHEGGETLLAVHEIDRQYHRNVDTDEVFRAIRLAVAEEHELNLNAIALIRHASLPRTTSGKPQRYLCRQLYENDELKLVEKWEAPNAFTDLDPSANAKGQDSGPPRGNGQMKATAESLGVVIEKGQMTAHDVDRLAERMEQWLLDWLVERGGVPSDQVTSEKPFAEYGLDSLTVVELSQELEDLLKIQLTPVVAWNYPTPATLSRFLAREAAGEASDGSGSETAPETTPTGESAEDFERLLAEVESLSDSEVEAALQRELGQ